MKSTNFTEQNAKEELKIHTELSTRYQEIYAQNTRDSDTNITNNAGFTIAQQQVFAFDDPLQQVILLNICHRQQNPRSTLPGFRICGAFTNIDKLKRHIASSGGEQMYGGVNLIKADAHKKFLICTSLKKQQSPEYVLEKIQTQTAIYEKTLRFHTEEFNENKEKRQQGKTGLSNPTSTTKKQLTSRKALLNQKFEDDKSNSFETGEIGRTAEVRGQSVAVITIFDDSSKDVLSGMTDPEPIVIIWGCFENETIAKQYINTTASKFVKDVNLDIVKMYEWIFPTLITDHVDELTEEYRNPSLNKIMHSRKAQKKTVMSYDEFCRSEGQQPSILEINVTKTSADSTEVHTEVKKTEGFEISVAVAPSKSEQDNKEAPPEWKSLPQTRSADLFQQVSFQGNSTGINASGNVDASGNVNVNTSNNVNVNTSGNVNTTC